jgi:hypothetical protein
VVEQEFTHGTNHREVAVAIIDPPDPHTSSTNRFNFDPATFTSGTVFLSSSPNVSISTDSVEISPCAYAGHTMGETQLLYEDGLLVGKCEVCAQRVAIRGGDTLLLEIFLGEARSAAVAAMCSDRGDDKETTQILTRFIDLEDTITKLAEAVSTADDLLKMAKRSLLKRVS